MSGIVNNPSRPTANTNKDTSEFIKQKEARALAFYQNNLELADPALRQVNRPQRLSSSSSKTTLQFARTTQLSITLQQQLAITNPELFKITSNTLVYPPSAPAPPPPPPVIPTFLLIPKANYPSISYDGTVSFYLGGTVRVQCASLFAGSYQWGPHFLFDGIVTDYDFVSDVPSSQYLILTFPVPVYIKQIFMIPRIQGAGLPTTINVKVDNVTSGSYTQTTVSNALGLNSPVFNGMGFYMQPNKSGTVWRFDFLPIDNYLSVGEMELWGYPV
jgi:hypothetical protein